MPHAFVIEPARSTDRDAILKVMAHWNMHHVPSEEMAELDLSCFFVARMNSEVVGASGYQILSPTEGKTTLMSVRPDLAGTGLGRALQDARLDRMASLGVQTVTTNADRPETIAWYKRHYGYREVGNLAKVHSFGHPDIDQWTTLKMDLAAWMCGRRTAEKDAVREPHPLTPYPPLLINVCLTGMIPTRDQSPTVPLSVEEIVADVVQVADAGAQIVHLHARDKDGTPTWKGEIYEAILKGIRRERPEMVCCVSTSGRNWPEFERRSEVLRLTADAKPDMASLTLGSMNFVSSASVNAPDMIGRLAEAMGEAGIRPELEVFEGGMLGRAKYLAKKGIIKPPFYFNLLLGNLGTTPATIGQLQAMIDALPAKSVWAAAGIGRFQLPMNVAALAAGGGVRIGLEDNIHYDLGRTKLASNVELVQRIVRIAQECERPLATPAQARAMLGLPQRG